LAEKKHVFIYQVIGHSIKSLLMTHEWCGWVVLVSFCLEETVEGGSFGNHCLFLRRLGYAGGPEWTCTYTGGTFIFLRPSEHHPHELVPPNIFLTSKFSYLLFCNPTHETETQTANMWELLIANHLDQSLWLTNQK
jgi:hypothetical protein